MNKYIRSFLICAALFLLLLPVTVMLLPKTSAVPIIDSEYANIGFSEDGEIWCVGESIEVYHMTRYVHRGENAVLEFIGEPKTEYEIRVYYASGLSTSKNFSPVTSDFAGAFGWSWKIPSNARCGDIRVVIISEKTRMGLILTIT